MSTEEREFDQEQQQLFLVLGGEVTDPRGVHFVDPEKLDIKGVFATYEAAIKVWRGAAQQTVDNAFMKYIVVRLR
ncbi:MAG: DUF4170 domain-containing protein [Alphaproteobacteria bacterium]